MKHLLILISFLLLSSLLTSCEKNEETLYKWKTSSGWEWKTMGDKNNNPQYKGEVKREYIIFGDYIIEGLGSLTFPDGRKYVGGYKDGKRNGQGTYTFPDGTKYVGEFKDNKPNGQGTHTLPDGSKKVGQFKDGSLHGQGTSTSSGGSKYYGEWKNGKPNGQGIITFSDGGNYEGEFKDGKRNGQGTETFPNKGKYVGEFNDGVFWNGTSYDKDGNIQVKFVNGEYNLGR